jgi:hypothetical protein
MVTLKVSEDARAMLRVLAAHKGKTMYDVAEDLFWAEAKRLKLRLAPQPATNGTRKERGK